MCRFGSHKHRPLESHSRLSIRRPLQYRLSGGVHCSYRVHRLGGANGSPKTNITETGRSDSRNGGRFGDRVGGDFVAQQSELSLSQLTPQQVTILE